MNPDDAENELIEALLEPLPKTGHHFGMARRMTGHARLLNPHDFVAASAEASAKFRAQPLHRRARSMPLLALFGLAVAAAFFLLPAAWREFELLLATQSDQLPKGAMIRHRARDVVRDRILARVGPKEGEILFGDLSAWGVADRWKSLAEKEPSDPGRLADAALGHLRGEGELPADFLAKAAALDPGNGWYAWLDGRARLGPFNSSSTQIESATRCFQRAVLKPRFSDPTLATWQERISLLPEELLWADVVAAHRYVSFEVPDEGHRFHPLRSFEFLGRRTFGPSADPNQQLAATLTYLELLERYTDEVRTWNGLKQTASYFPHTLAGVSAGPLPSIPQPEVEEQALDEIMAIHAAIGIAGAAPGIPATRLASRLDSGPASDPALARPGIGAEWAMHERLLLWFAVFVSGLLLAAHLAALQSNRGHEMLSRRLGQLLTRADKALILGVSLGLPLLIYLLATRLPGHGLLAAPLAEDHDPRFAAMAVLIAGWIVAVPLLALEATRWRLAVRGRALGLGGGGVHLGVIPLALVLGSIIGTAILPAVQRGWTELRWPLAAAAGGVALGAVWLLVLVVWHFAASHDGFPERLLRLRVAFGPVLAALLITASGALALRAYECHLVSINRFERSPRIHGGNRSSVDQALFEKWKPVLLDAIRRVRAQLEAHH